MCPAKFDHVIQKNVSEQINNAHQNSYYMDHQVA